MTAAIPRAEATSSSTASTCCSTATACPIDFKQVQGCLFDIDGTLCNSDPLHFQAFQEILIAEGFNNGQPIDEHFFRVHISGRHNPEIAADLWPDKPEEWRTDFYMRKEELYRNLAGTSLKPLSGLPDFLAWVDKRGLRRVAVTNAPRANAEMMLGGLGLTPFFEKVVLGEECTRPKPFPDPYLDGLATIGLSGQASKALVLEDSPAGIKAAVAAGIPTIGLTTGQSAEALKAAGAVVVVDDFLEVMALIDAQGCS